MFDAVGALLCAFRAVRVTPTRASPLDSPSPSVKPATPRGEDRPLPPLSLAEESAPAEDAAAAVVEGPPAHDNEESAPPPAGNDATFTALFDRLAAPGDKDGDTAADAPDTPSGSPPNGGGGVLASFPLASLKSLSRRLSASVKRAGEEIIDALDKL